MSPPELPGFYYDAAKRKYFRIANGDQRVNSSYTNNAIRVKERRERYETSVSKKPRTQGDDAEADLSRALDIAANSTTPSDQFLRVKLALSSPQSMFHHVLTDYSELSGLQSCSIWPAFEKHMCFTVQGSLLKLHACAHGGNLSNAVYTHSLFPHLPIDPAVDNHVNDILILHGWVFVQFGKLFSVTKWEALGQNRFNVTDHTQRIELDISNAYANNQAERPSLERAMGSLQNIGREPNLCLLLASGHSVVYNLQSGMVIHTKRVIESDYSTPMRSLRIVHGIWGVQHGKALTLVDYKTLKQRRFSFESQIYHFELEMASPRIIGLKPTIDMIVVTQKKVILRKINTKTLKSMSLDQSIAIHNDNQSQPLVHKSGDYLIVEELPNVMKIINFASCLTERKSIDVSIIARTGKPRLVCVGDNVFWSDCTVSLKYT